jgi:hypothetical protein
MTGDQIEQNNQLIALYSGRAAFQACYPILKEVRNAHNKRVRELSNAFAYLKQQEPGLMRDVYTQYANSVVMTHQGATTMQ